MADYYVKGPGNVNHDGVDYNPGDKVPGLSKEQASELLKAGAVQTQDPQNGKTPNLVPTDEELANAPTGQPTAEEIAKAAEEAGGTPSGPLVR